MDSWWSGLEHDEIEICQVFTSTTRTMRRQPSEKCDVQMEPTKEDTAKLKFPECSSSKRTEFPTRFREHQLVRKSTSINEKISSGLSLQVVSAEWPQQDHVDYDILLLRKKSTL